MTSSKRHGRCLCGAVTFKVTGKLRKVLVCHCSQCRRSSGHLWAATAAPVEAIEIDSQNCPGIARRQRLSAVSAAAVVPVCFGNWMGQAHCL